MKITHVALWTCDLEAAARFWAEYFGATIGAKYESTRRAGFSSRFATLADGPTIELMSGPWIATGGASDVERLGWDHVAITAGAGYYQDGDSVRWVFAMEGNVPEPPEQHPYFGREAAQNPLAFPLRSNEILSKFPPSLLISSTRDLALSSVVNTHSTLVRLGRESQLHVWEGMGHCFFNGGPFPQTHEANDVIVRFFDKHLGKDE